MWNVMMMKCWKHVPFPDLLTASARWVEQFKSAHKAYNTLFISIKAINKNYKRWSLFRFLDNIDKGYYNKGIMPIAIGEVISSWTCP